MSVQARNALFTQFLETSSASGGVLMPDDWPDVAFCTWQLESCPDTGKLHYQGYVEFVGKKTWNWCHTHLSGLETAHFERRRGTQAQAIAYCNKLDSRADGPWQYGEARAQGARSDLVDIKRKIDDGVAINSLYDEHFGSMIRYKRQFIEYKRVTTSSRSLKTKTFLFVGPPGKGKSTLMKVLARYLGRVYVQPFKKGSGLYFDDYDGEDVMIIDEFDGDVMTPKMFNAIADEHPCVLPVHGGAGHQMVSRYLFLGSNYAPQSWWKKRNASQLRQTTRRIDVVFKVGLEPNPNPLGFSRQLLFD